MCDINFLYKRIKRKPYKGLVWKNGVHCEEVGLTGGRQTKVLGAMPPICTSSFGFVSMHSQAWVALSKIVVILKPHRHAQFISRTSCYRTIASTWIVGAGVGAFHTM